VLRRRPGESGDQDEVVVLSQRSLAVPLAVPLGDFVLRNGGPPYP